MKKVVLILLAILMITTLALGFTACKSECDKGNHIWDQGTVTKEATCSEAGKMTYKCTVCDHGQKVENIPATNNHTPVDASNAPNCTDAGVKEATKCSVCGVTINAGTAEPALGHLLTYVATPGDDSTHEEKCTREGCVYSKTVAHTPNADGSACQYCGKPYSSGLPVHEHDKYIVSTTPATCLSKAVEHWACHDGCGWTEDIEVGEVLQHNYQGQPWKTFGENHYQECKNGCGVRNEHAADMSAYALVDGQHVSACSHCSIAVAHAPSFGAYVTTDNTNHYKLCSKCDLKTDEGEHNHNKLTNLNGDQHGVACSVCSKKFDNAAHVWVLNEQAGEAATCTKEGKAVSNCACGRTKTETLPMIDHSYTHVDNDEARVYTCSVCEHVETVPHVFDWDNSIKDEHYKKCQTCGYILESTRGAHVYSNGFTCETCNRTIEGIVALTYYNNVYTRHDTLVAAVNSITDNKAAIIYLGQNLEGAGIFIPEGRNITLLLQGNTYTVASGAVGSTGTETQGLHIEKDSNVTINNGTVTSKAGSGVKMLVQNYANLTLDGVILDGTNLDSAGSAKNYTLSNNYGSVKMTSTTVNAKTSNGVAFDLWYGSHESYLGGVSVTVGANCNINGAIEYGSAVADVDWSKVALRLENKTYTIKFSSTNVTCDAANIVKVVGVAETHLDHMKDANWTCKNDKHYHVCSRCFAHLDEAPCVRVEKDDAEAPTCTATGLTATVWCATCEHVYVDQTTIDALGHDYQGVQTTAPTCEEKGLTTYTCSRCGDSYTEDIDALGHAWNEGVQTTAPTCTTAGVKTFTCSRCGDTRTETIPATGHTKGDEYVTTEQGHAHKCTVCESAAEAYSDHKYNNNVCVCGHEITVAEIYDLYTNYTSDKENTNGTFKLVGKVKVIRTAYSAQYKNMSFNMEVKDGDKTYEFYCFRVGDANKIVGFDVQVGDVVTIVGCGIVKFNGSTLEIVNATFEKHELATYTITKTVNDEQVTVSEIVTSAKRGEEIKFTVTAKEGYRIDGVTLNGQQLTLQDGKYAFTVTAENVIVIKSSLADQLPSHNDPTPNTPTTLVINGTHSPGTYSNGTFVSNGVKFNYYQLTTNTFNTINELQINKSKGSIFSNAILSQITSGVNQVNTPFTGAIKKIELKYGQGTSSSQTNAKHTLTVLIANNPEFTEAETIVMSESNTSYEVTMTDGLYISFEATGTGAAYFESITITYMGQGACVNNQSPSHVKAVGATCNTDGNHEYWQCQDCGKYFMKDDADNYIEVTQADTIDKAGHTPATTWTQGTVDGKLSHYHVCVGCGEKLDIVECNQNETIAGKAATCTETGLKDGKMCDVCGQVTLEQQETPALGHDLEYVAYDNGKHFEMCSRTDCEYAKDNVTCTAIDDELHKDTEYHWYLCVCGNKVDKAIHNYGADDKCECGAEKDSIEAKDIVWSVYTGILDNDHKLSETDGMALIKGLAATQFVGDTVTFTIDENYRVVSITNVDMSDEDMTATTLTLENGGYSFVASADGNFIDIVVVRQYTVALAEDTDSAITVTLDGKELPNKFDEETSSILVINLGSKAETHRLATVTYKADGGNAEFILNADGTYSTTIPVNKANVTITITIEPKPADPITLTRDNLFATLIASGTKLSYANTPGDYTVDGQTFTVSRISSDTAYNSDSTKLYPLQMANGDGTIKTTGKFSKLTIVIMFADNAALAAKDIAFNLNGVAISANLDKVKATKEASEYNKTVSKVSYPISYYTIEIDLDNTESKEYTLVSASSAKYVKSMTWTF